MNNTTIETVNTTSAKIALITDLMGRNLDAQNQMLLDTLIATLTPDEKEIIKGLAHERTLFNELLDEREIIYKGVKFQCVEFQAADGVHFNSYIDGDVFPSTHKQYRVFESKNECYSFFKDMIIKIDNDQAFNETEETQTELPQNTIAFNPTQEATTDTNDTTDTETHEETQTPKQDTITHTEEDTYTEEEMYINEQWEVLKNTGKIELFKTVFVCEYSTYKNRECVTYGHYGTRVKNTYKYIKKMYVDNVDNTKDRFTQKLKMLLTDDTIKKESQTKRKNYVNPYKIGDVFKYSYGYSMTAYNFYQCVSVKGKTMMMKKISKSHTHPITGKQTFDGWRGDVFPEKDNFLNDKEFKANIRINCYGNESITIKGRDQIHLVTDINSGFYEDHCD